MVYRTQEELLARPGQTVDDHRRGVRENARLLVPERKEVAAGWTLESIVTTLADLHDIGKLTQWFQEYIHEEDTCSRSELYKRHSLVSAYLCFHALDSMDVPDDVALAGFYAVAKHHSVLPDFDTNHKRYCSLDGTDAERGERVGEQLQNIDTHVSGIADDILSRATGGAMGWDDVFVEQPMTYPKGLPGTFSPDEPDEFYQLVLRLWSTLVCADKLDAAGLTAPAGCPSLPDRDNIAFDNDETNSLRSTLNDKRTTARQDVTQRLDALGESESVFTLTLPTGFGKTFAGLEAALADAERNGGRVVYALPFTTVIDQTHDEITEQLGVTPDRERYTLHHYLADTRTKPAATADKVADGSEVLYGKSWQSGLVLTTFVQLFESLAGPQNTQSIKLPALQDSVIVVDEPQALSRDWWYLVSRLTTVLTEEYDATVILMTATQPGIISNTHPDLDPTELVPDAESYFDFLAEHERVQFELDDSVTSHIQGDGQRLSLETAATTVTNELKDDEITSVLAVSNTVRSAAALYRELVTTSRKHFGQVISLGDALDEFREDTSYDLHEAADDGDDKLERVVSAYLSAVGARIQTSDTVVVGALSTALRPVDRVILIEAIRRVLDDDRNTPIDGCSLAVSSTQLVEAGVDVSFDCLFRDYAPIPSVVQAAGRCNRSFGGETATVTLWRLQGVEDNPPPSCIYRIDGNLLKPTTYALASLSQSHGSTIPEREMVSTGVSDYYTQLHDDDNRSVETDSLARAFDTADGETLREASLVDDDGQDAVVVVDDTDAELLRAYLRARAHGSYTAAARLFDQLNYLTASIRETLDDDLETFLADETQLDAEDFEAPELLVADVRESGGYDVADGSGIREL